MKKRRGEASKTQTMLDHVRELQVRLIVCVVVLVIGSGIGYLLFDPILGWLRAPLGENLYYMTPTGSFGFVMKVAFMVGVAVTLPVLIYQLIMFIRPAVAEGFTRTRVHILTLASVILAAAGALFGYYTIVPGALHFFKGFQVSGLSALISADSYLNFVTNVLITFMIVFQIPLIMIIIDRIKPIPPKRLLKMEKFVILAGLLVSLVVPFAMDLTTSLLIATPIVLLYNVSVAMIVIRHALVKRRTLRAEQLYSDDMQINDEILAELAESVQIAVTQPLITIRPQTTSRPDVHKMSKRSQEEMMIAARAQREQMRLERIKAIENKKYRQISGIQ